jgi:hypothetical protein
MGRAKNRPEGMMAAEPPEPEGRAPLAQARMPAVYARPVSTCPRCGRPFRAESRTRVECPFCGYRLLGGL